jgi:hypothetical protein
MGLGQLRGPFWETSIPLDCPIQKDIFAWGGMGVCDGAHRVFVMKKLSTQYPANPSWRFLDSSKIPGFTRRRNPRSRKARALAHPRWV